MLTPRVGKEALWFHSACKRNGLSVSDDRLELLERYVSQLLEWNKKLNLISRKDEENIWRRHILQSASLFFHVSLVPDRQILDLGTGGGLPGIPIKILSPHLSVTLIDSVRKKILAVESILRELSLHDVRVACGRAEDLAKREEFRNQFDYVIVRGVATLKELVQWSLPFLQRRKSEAAHSNDDPHMRFIEPPALIALKGGDLGAEIRQASKSKRVKELTIVDLTIDMLGAAQDAERKAIIVHFK